MFTKRSTFQNTFAKITASILMLGFFVCITHITPQVFHEEQPTHESTSHSQNHESHSDALSCVDDESYLLGNTNVNNFLSFVIPTISFEKLEISNNSNTSFVLDIPPKEKIPIYLKNNILLI